MPRATNLWRGNKVAANPGGHGFTNQFTGTEGNIHIGWIGKLRGNDGTLLAASYLAGYFRHSKLTQKPYPEPVHDGWPSHNDGWPNVTTTTVETGSIRCDRHGRVSIVGKWTYPSEGAQPEGSGNTEIRSAFPIDEGVIAVGRHLAKEGKALGNPIPVNRVPGWGRLEPKNLTAIFAALPYEP